MNKNQRIALICGVLFIILTILFPPWISRFKVESYDSQHSAGYHFITKSPENNDRRVSITMDVTRLLIQGIGIVLLTGLAIFIFNSPGNGKTPESKPTKLISKTRSARIKEED